MALPVLLATATHGVATTPNELARVASLINGAGERERLKQWGSAAAVNLAATFAVAPDGLRSAYGALGSFGAVRTPPLSLEQAGDQQQLESIIGMQCSTFAPLRVRSSRDMQVSAALAAILSQCVLAVTFLEDLGGARASVVQTLRALEGWQVMPALLAFGLSGALLGSTIEALVLQGGDRLVLRFFAGLLWLSPPLEQLVRATRPARQEAILRHEAGHFLAAHLLGCPVQACQLGTVEALFDTRFGGEYGTIFHSDAMAAMRDDGGDGDGDGDGDGFDERRQPLVATDVDVAAIVLMAGIAAEAIEYGNAEGGVQDEAMLRRMLVREARQQASLAPPPPPPPSPQQRQPSLAGEADAVLAARMAAAATAGAADAAIRARARWAAANAVVLLREHRREYEALCDALRRGESVGSCAVAIERAWAEGE